MNQSPCRTSIGYTRINNLDFANYSDSLHHWTLFMALEAMHEVAKQFGLKISKARTKKLVASAWILVEDTLCENSACMVTYSEQPKEMPP